MTHEQLRSLLENKYQLYHNEEFIETDPIQVPHRFFRKEDIELSAFLTATLAWGNRRAIIKSALQLMERMDNAPYDFISEASEADFAAFHNFVYRTFNGIDCRFFLQSLQSVYNQKGGLEAIFTQGYQQSQSIFGALVYFRSAFLSSGNAGRTQKHVADVSRNASAKRLNMFLRWMVRNEEGGVDFGLWNRIPTSALMIPLDVHSGSVARNWGLLHRKQNDWKAVEELTAALRTFDALDPVKYDFALFGSGVFEK